jgi:7-cyano-7-deazaguanine synthase in queuosine biosynthesis
MSAIHVAYRWPKTKANRKADYDCVIGQDLKISPAALQDFSADILEPFEQDLVIVAGAIAYADRMVNRKRGQGWARDLILTIPVAVPHIWSKPEITTALLDALEYVSGDRWSFNFVQGPDEVLAKKQSSLDFKLSNYVVLPFSDGMDSYLQWQLLKKEEPESNILRVYTSSRASNRSRNKKIDANGDKRDQRLGMPVSLSVGDHAEATYRTRTFLFFTIAALAAHMAGTSRVVIGENGIGMFGPGLVPFGDECPHRTTHPAFTRRLAVFLNRLLGSKIAFEHPQQFKTKGQVLRHALSLGVTGWENTHSCTRTPRSQLSGKPCGICGGCLLRRTAMNAAELKDDEYFWSDLSGATLDDCRSDVSGRTQRPSDIDIARHGIFDMTSFADLAAKNTDELFQRAAWEFFGKPDPKMSEIAAKLRSLAAAHATEWNAFRNRFRSGGILND